MNILLGQDTEVSVKINDPEKLHNLRVNHDPLELLYKIVFKINVQIMFMNKKKCS